MFFPVRLLALVCFWSLTLLNPPSATEASENLKPRVQVALPDFLYSFPRDHGSHDDFLIEWWYFTGHLFTPEGRRFGYELTFFRRLIDDERAWGNPSRWAMRQLYFAHFALLDEKAGRFRYKEKISRSALGRAGAKTGTLNTWIDRWGVQADSIDHRRLHLHASSREFGIDLKVESQKPPVVHGLKGVSLKGEAQGQASHYYSMTRLDTKGSLWIDGENLEVRGTSWMDHEFGSADLGQSVVGWDWFSLQLETGHEIMAYWLRRKDGTFIPASSGTLVFPDGSNLHLSQREMKLDILDHWTSKDSGAHYPSRWNLKVFPLEIEIYITPRFPNQELITKKSTQVTYWEGATDVWGTMGDSQIKGMGYVELTGYAQPFR